MTAPDARRIHFDAIVIDGHADTIDRVVDRGEDLTVRTDRGHIDLPRMTEGGLDVQFFSCFVHPRYIERKECILRALRMIDAVKRTAAMSQGRLEVARSAAEIRRVVGAGNVAGVLCIEGGHAIEDDLGVLRLYHELGVRYMTLTWNNTHNWADGCGGPMRHNGLTEFGREVVREMNRIGMIVDISHVAEKTFYDALGVTQVPVMCSHSCARSLCDHRRNLRDDQLRAVAKNGGVVCVNFYSGFLSEEFRKADLAQDEEREREIADARRRFADDTAALDRTMGEIYDRYIARLPRPELEILLRHIDHIAERAGIDHVGLGSDFDGVTNLPKGMDDCTKLPLVTEALLHRGYGESDVKKILGENVLRVIEAAVDSAGPARISSV